MAARLTRLILGILLLISQFLDPASRWLSWSVVVLLLFEGVTNIRIAEALLKRLKAGKSLTEAGEVPDST